MHFFTFLNPAPLPLLEQHPSHDHLRLDHLLLLLLLPLLLLRRRLVPVRTQAALPDQGGVSAAGAAPRGRGHLRRQHAAL